MRNARRVVFVIMLACCVGVALGDMILDDGLTYNIIGSIYDDVDVHDDNLTGFPTTVNLLNNGYIIRGLRAYDHSIITISGGSVNSSLSVWDNSEITVFSGSIGSNLSAHNNSKATISGGRIYGPLEARDNSVINFSDGTIDDYVRTYENSVVTISGGSVGGSVFQYGPLEARGNSQIILKGSDFAVGGTPIGYGIIDSEGYDWIQGRLTGILANGDTLNNDFAVFYGSSIVLIPEPATLLLLGLGAVVVRKRL